MPAVEAWEGAQRHGQDIAERWGSLVQGLGCQLQTHLLFPVGACVQSQAGGYQSSCPLSADDSYPDQSRSAWLWPWQIKPHSKSRGSFDSVALYGSRTPTEQAAPGSTNHDSPGMHELAQRICQAGADLGATVGGFVTSLSEHVTSVFRAEPDPQFTNSSPGITLELEDHIDGRDTPYEVVCASNGSHKSWKRGFAIRQNGNEETRLSQGGHNYSDLSNEKLFSLFTMRQGQLHRQGTVNVTTTYDSRTQEVESSVTARGDLWRAEASHGRSSRTNGPSPLYLLQIGPILFVRDSTLLLPIHLSKQHLLWYGFDRKNGVHSICPAVWSRHRRWLLMSMICLSPFTCSFVDVQFPNGQFTYVAGEGVTGSVFYPFCGGLLQAQTHRPGITKISYSRKMIWGTRLTPALEIPEKSVSLDIVQPIAWQRSGIMVRPTVHLRVAPTVGGRNAGWRAELAHSPRERISWACGCKFTVQPTAYASITVGKFKRDANDLASSGLVFTAETPLESLYRASYCIQLNSGLDF